jgi:hypothetical protein
MFTNILKWTFKVAVGEVEKELNLHLDNDTPLEAVEQVAFQMIAHCAKIKDAAKAQQEAQKQAQEPVATEQPVSPIESDKVEPIVPPIESPQPDPIDELKQMLEGNEHV